MFLWLEENSTFTFFFQVNLFTCLPNVSHDQFTYTSNILCLFLLPVLCNFTLFVDCNLKPFTPKEFILCSEKELKGRVVHKVQVFVSLIDKTSPKSFPTYVNKTTIYKISNCKKLFKRSN